MIIRTLFSIPIEHEVAQKVFHEFRAYQRTQPILNLAAFLPLPRWFPRFHRRATRRSAALIRRLIAGLCEARAGQIAAGTAPDDHRALQIATVGDHLRRFGWFGKRRRGDRDDSFHAATDHLQYRRMGDRLRADQRIDNGRGDRRFIADVRRSSAS